MRNIRELIRKDYIKIGIKIDESIIDEILNNQELLNSFKKILKINREVE